MNRCTASAALFLALVGQALAIEGPPPPNAKAATEAAPQEPVHVWADKVRYVREESLVRVTGNATIIKQDLRIDGDEVLAYLDENNQFTRIVATGDVHIYSVKPLPKRTTERPPVQPKADPDYRKAVCHTADYDLKTNIVILRGNPEEPEVQPIVWVNKDEVHADEIVFDQNKNTTLFKGQVKLSALTPKGEEGGVQLPGPGTE
jgi:lipopolysaccharide transport protein LptA